MQQDRGANRATKRPRGRAVADATGASPDKAPFFPGRIGRGRAGEGVVPKTIRRRTILTHECSRRAAGTWSLKMSLSHRLEGVDQST